MSRFSPTVLPRGSNIGAELAGAFDRGMQTYQMTKQQGQQDRQQQIGEALQALQLQHAGIHKGQAPLTPVPLQIQTKPGAFDPTTGTFAPSTIVGTAPAGGSPLQPRQGVTQLTPGYYQDQTEADAYTAKEEQAKLAQILAEYGGKAQIEAQKFQGEKTFEHDLTAPERAAQDAYRTESAQRAAAALAETARHNRVTEGLLGKREQRAEAKSPALPVSARKYWADAILAQYEGDPAKALASPEAQEKGLGMADFAGSSQRQTDAAGRSIFGQAGRMLSSFADTSVTHAIGQATDLYGRTHKRPSHAPDPALPTTSNTGAAVPTTADDILKHYKLTPKR